MDPEMDEELVQMSYDSVPDAPIVFAPGLYDGIPEDIYHRSAGVSKSKLSAFAQAPVKVLSPVPETDPLRLGSLIHCAILEPALLDARFYVSDLPRFTLNSKAFKDEVANAGGRTIVKRAEFDSALRVRDSVMGNPTVRELLEAELVIEQSAFWTDDESGLLCRGRMDVIRIDWRVIVDIKTTVNAGPDEFAKTAAKYHYHWQQSMYEDGILLVADWDPEAFVFVAVEKEPPHLVALYDLHPDDVEAGRQQVRQLLNQWAECERTGVWPGYSSQIERLRLPWWATARAF